MLLATCTPLPSWCGLPLQWEPRSRRPGRGELAGRGALGHVGGAGFRLSGYRPSPRWAPLLKENGEQASASGSRGARLREVPLLVMCCGANWVARNPGPPAAHSAGGFGAAELGLRAEVGAGCQERS